MREKITRSPRLRKVQKLETNREFFEFRTKSRKRKMASLRRRSDVAKATRQMRQSRSQNRWSMGNRTFFSSVLFLNVPFIFFSVQNRIDRKKPVKAELIAVSCVCVFMFFHPPLSFLCALSFHPFHLFFFVFSKVVKKERKLKVIWAEKRARDYHYGPAN